MGDGPRAVWLADWSDEEHAAFLAAVPQAQVLRSAPLGRSVGGRWHRVRSYPAYAALAVRGVRAARTGGAVVVAWQPLAGALCLLLPRRWRPPVVLLNPILSAPGSAGAGSARQRAVLVAARRAAAVVVYTSQGRDDVHALGVDADRLHVVRLGVPVATPSPPVGVDGAVLALGRDHRDWDVLAEASRRSGVPVDVAGPDRVPAPLRLLRPVDRTELAGLLRAARAVVVPLLDASRQAGTLAVLDALVAGRPVVATAGPGTIDYVRDAGVLVPPRDVDALASALVATRDPVVLARWSAAARTAAADLGTAGFADRVGAVVSQVVGDSA